MSVGLAGKLKPIHNSCRHSRKISTDTRFLYVFRHICLSLFTLLGYMVMNNKTAKTTSQRRWGIDSHNKRDSAFQLTHLLIYKITAHQVKIMCSKVPQTQPGFKSMFCLRCHFFFLKYLVFMGKNGKSKIVIEWRINFFHLNQDIDFDNVPQVS